MEIYGMEVIGKPTFVIAASSDLLMVTRDATMGAGFVTAELFKHGWYLDANLASTPDLSRAMKFKTVAMAAQWLKTAKLIDKRSRRELRDYDTEEPITVAQAFQIEEIVTLVKSVYTTTGKYASFDGRR